MAKTRQLVPKVNPERRALPFDILHLLLGFLPQTDLRKAAAASRTFREAAKQTGLHIHRKIMWHHRHGVQREIDTFLEVLEYALAEDCRLSLLVICLFSHSIERMKFIFTGFLDTVELLATCISKALPIMTFLRISVSDYFRDALDVALCHPAPHIRTFEINYHAIVGGLRQTLLVPLPAALFAGDAPKLRRVSLEHVALRSDPIPTFCRVVHAQLRYDDVLPAIRVARHFPELTSLYIEYLRESVADSISSGLNLSGLSLAALTIDTNDENLRSHVAQELDLGSIGTVEDFRTASTYPEVCKWDWTMRAEDCTGLAAAITGDARTAEADDEDVDIVVSSQLRTGWRRAFRIPGWSLSKPYPLLGQGTGLVSLCIENVFIGGLLESGISLSALRELLINLRASGRYATMIWPLAWGIKLDEGQGGEAQGLYNVPCPRLETLTIAAVYGAPMQVKLSEVAQLGTALGQLKRRDGGRARLILRGVSLQVPSLDQMFSSVQELAHDTT
ncbi:hypothetical protein AURDEDRAFT_182629 [Auricularia subglabra TFB-10046 SS5]|nr:hypothetical protein AURDEDRAFT_182629 [Auricularia subglabra TFB-10046 SS5]